MSDKEISAQEVIENGIRSLVETMNSPCISVEKKIALSEDLKKSLVLAAGVLGVKDVSGWLQDIGVDPKILA